MSLSRSAAGLAGPLAWPPAVWPGPQLDLQFFATCKTFSRSVCEHSWHETQLEMADPAPACVSTGGQSSGAAKCPEHVLQAIYGKTAEKRKLYEQSLNRCAARGTLLAVWRVPYSRPVALLVAVAT